MGFYRFIKAIGPEAKYTGYFVPRMYHLSFHPSELKLCGFQFVKDRLRGGHVWWVQNEADYNKAVETLNELKKTRIFDFKVTDPLQVKES